MSTVAFRTSNPALQDSVFREAGYVTDRAQTMTVEGTAIKTLVLVGILVATACYTWSQTFLAAAAAEGAGAGAGVFNPQAVSGYMIAGALGGFLVALLTIFMPRISPWTAPLYAALEGLFLGGISAIFQHAYAGIVFQAVGLTIGTLIVLMTAYATGMVRVTQGFKAGVIAATGAVCLVYLINFILSLFGIPVPFLHDNGPIGIGISLVIVVIAALNLVLDFDLIAKNAQGHAPKFMEWYCGFSLLVTLVWLYLEILRLLAKLRSRD